LLENVTNYGAKQCNSAAARSHLIGYSLCLLLDDIVQWHSWLRIGIVDDSVCFESFHYDLPGCRHISW